MSYGAAEFDPDPRRRVWILWVNSKNESSWEAHQAHESEGRSNAHFGDPPVVGYDLRDPPLPKGPSSGCFWVSFLSPLDHCPQRVYQVE